MADWNISIEDEDAAEGPSEGERLRVRETEDAGLLMEKGGRFQLVTASDTQFRTRTPTPTTDVESENEEATFATGELDQGKEEMSEQDREATDQGDDDTSYTSRTKSHSGSTIPITNIPTGNASANGESYLGNSTEPTGSYTSEFGSADVDKSYSSDDRAQSSGSTATINKTDSNIGSAGPVEKNLSATGVDETLAGGSATTLSGQSSSSAAKINFESMEKSHSNNSSNLSGSLLLDKPSPDGGHGSTVGDKQSNPEVVKSNTGSSVSFKSGNSSQEVNKSHTIITGEEKPLSSLHKATPKDSQSKGHSLVSSARGNLSVGFRSASSQSQPLNAKAAAALGARAKSASDEMRDRKKMNDSAYDSWLTKKNIEILDRRRRDNSRENPTTEEQEQKREMCQQVYRAWLDRKAREVREIKSKKKEASRSGTSTTRSLNESLVSGASAFQSWLENKRKQKQRESELMARKFKEEEEVAKKVNTSVCKEAYRR